MKPSTTCTVDDNDGDDDDDDNDDDEDDDNDVDNGNDDDDDNGDDNYEFGWIIRFIQRSYLYSRGRFISNKNIF